ncbi:hypothetical protein [Nocardia asiatica]|uniref:hypothetical protein n=1 Tax=Nocardia asiatica TaxID=209252 RepID=UPI0002FA115B|nr:hypothetical protein [Nocardia asiatica]
MELTDDRPGKVHIRRTDGLIDYTGAFSPMTPANTLSLAAALIATVLHQRQQETR